MLSKTTFLQKLCSGATIGHRRSMRFHATSAAWSWAPRNAILMLVILSLMLGTSAIVPISVSEADLVDGVYHDTFNVILEGNNVVDSSGTNTGYNNGTWYKYDNGWINQWFFNGEDIRGSKTIEWDITISPAVTDAHGIGSADIADGNGDPGRPPQVDLAINWSDQAWANDGLGGVAPPLPDNTLGDKYIVRHSLMSNVGLDRQMTFNNVGDPLWIPDYNPQWVSIDIRVIDPGIIGDDIISGPSESFPQISLQGEIWHRHIPVPEPSSLMYLGLVGLGLLGWKTLKLNCATE